MSKIVSDKNGKVEELSQWTVKDGTTVLTEDANGNIVEKNISDWDEISKTPQELANDVEAINEVARWNGQSETTAQDLKTKGFRAILEPIFKNF